MGLRTPGELVLLFFLVQFQHLALSALVLLVLFVYLQHLTLAGLVLLVVARSLGDWETGPQDSWRIGLICAFGTVSGFGIISIGFSRSIGIVAPFDPNRIGVIGCRTNST